ncbi:hypothetical protein [Ramlibacter sp. PS4R-6]|uniref:hypothetical protein n=1 Tax=Ramlibacter sp. PS4R-6 TaxID=3133438 RepID=UPI0030957956
MRKLSGPIKQSGDVHPPELDDGFDDDLEVSTVPTADATARPVTRAASRPSLMPLLGWAAAAFLLYRLTR